MLGTLLVLASLVAGQAEAADGDLPLEVRRLVRQLNAPTLADRDAAEQKLLELGPRVLDLLPPLTARTSAEERQRIGRIQQKLQHRIAEASVRTSTVTLKGENVLLSKVLSAVQEQTGNKIVDIRGQFGHEVTDPKLSVDFQGRPFWQALDHVLDQAGLTVYPFAQERAIHVIARPENQRPRSEGAGYVGPFRLEPQKIVAQRDLRNPAQKSLMLQLEVAWEPRLRPITIKQKLGELKATDESGQPLPVAAGEGELEVPGGADATATNLMLPFQLPPRSVGKIARLAGKLTATIPGKIETFTFDDLEAKDVEKRVAGVRVTLEGVRKNNDLREVRLRIKFDEAGDALASHRNWIFNNEAYLVNAAGEKLEYETLETTHQAEDEVGVAYLFFLKKAITEYKFVYKTPGVIVASDFDYELKDVELP